MRLDSTSIWSRILQVRTDPEAVKDLVVRRYRPPVYEYARFRGLSHEDAEDVAQEVFIHVCSDGFLEKADRQKGKFRTLMLAVARHVIASHQRYSVAARRDRRRQVPLQDFEFPDKPPVDDDFDDAWAQNLLRLAAERLGNHPSLDLLIAHARGTRYADIAVRVGKSERAVEGLIYRIRERLRHEIERLVAEYTLEGGLDEELGGMFKLMVQVRGR